MAPKTIAVIGAMFAELVMISDRYPDRGESLLGEEFYEGPGGKGANAAIATYRSSHANPATLHNDSGSLVAAAEPANQQDDDLKINVRMVGAVANDKYGNDLQAALKSTGVDCSGVMVFEGPGDRTGVAFCMVDNVTRDNRCLFHRGVTARWQRLDFKNAIDLGHGVVPDLCVAQMEIHPDVVQQMIETAGAAKIDFVLNAAPAGTIEYHTYKWITHLIVNETEAAILSGLEVDEVHEKSWESVCLDFLNRGVKNVVITLSEKGAYYANADKRGHCPGYKVLVEDTTGAGDTFVAAYSCDYLKQITPKKENWDIEKAVIRANKAAAMTVTKLGSQAGIPWSNETDIFDAPLWRADLAAPKIIEDPVVNTVDKQ